MSQTTHPAPVLGKSQCARIFATLASRAGAWVPMPELSAAGNPGGFCMVHSRVADLRKRGLPYCPCGTRGVRYTGGCWTCQRCLDRDAAIYGTASIRSACGFRDRTPRGEPSLEAA